MYKKKDSENAEKGLGTTGYRYNRVIAGAGTRQHNRYNDIHVQTYTGAQVHWYTDRGAGTRNLEPGTWNPVNAKKHA
jgi:hypothetical protein